MSQNDVIYSGRYTGNGTDTQTVSIGWKPALLITWSDDISATATSTGLAVKLGTVTGSDCLACQATSFLTQGISFNSDGFSVLAAAPFGENNRVYHYIAMRDSPSLMSGSYVGTGATMQVTTPMKVDSVFLIRFQGAVPSFVMKFPAQDSTLTFRFGTDANQFQGISLRRTGSNGFTLTNNAIVNTRGETYHWVATSDVVGSTSHFTGSKYAGDGILTSKLIELGMPPKFIIIAGTNDVVPIFAFSTNNKSSGSTDDDYGKLTSQYAYDTTDGITATSTGFMVGIDLNTILLNYEYYCGFY